MNRSILIVTCDFLVLAAMSLSIGMSEVGDTSGGMRIQTSANRLVEMIDEELARQEALKLQNAELEKRLEEFRALALQSGKEAADRDVELARAKKDLDERDEALKRSAEALAQKKNELELSAKEIRERDRAIREGEQQIADRDAELARAHKEKTEADETIRRQEQLLAQANEEIDERDRTIGERDRAIRESESLLEKSELNLAQANREKAEANERSRQSERTLARTSDQLEMVLLQLDALRDQSRIDRERLAAAEEKLHARELELVKTRSDLTDTQKQLSDMRTVLTDVSLTLTSTQKDLTETQEKAAVAQAEIRKNEEILKEKDERLADNRRDLDEAKTEAADLKKMLSNDVLTSYNDSALELSFHIINDRLFNNITIDKSFFLPSITIDGKNWIVSAFRDTTGLNLHSGYTKVIELQYKVRRPQSKDKWELVTGPALCLNEDIRVCLFPVGEGKAKPMRALTFPALRERGVDNLTLFKSGTFSKASAELTGRCSLSLEQDDHYLYIRNPNRSSTELKAEVGDIVLSKEGFFVGVVVKVSSSDLGRTSTALCFVFPNVPDLSKAARLRLTKERSQSHFFDFVSGHEALRKRAEQLDREK